MSLRHAVDIFHKIRKFDWYRTAMLISTATCKQFDKVRSFAGALYPCAPEFQARWRVRLHVLQMGRGGHPLHVALGARQVVPADIIYDMLAAYPEACQFADRAGKYPLHYAAEYNSCEPEVFRVILEAYPDAARQKNKWGQLPIHYATWRRAPPELIRMLHDAYPEGATLRDTLGCGLHGEPGLPAEPGILNKSLGEGALEALQSMGDTVSSEA